MVAKIDFETDQVIENPVLWTYNKSNVRIGFRNSENVIIDLETKERLPLEGNVSVQNIIFSTSFQSTSGQAVSLGRDLWEKNKFHVLWNREPKSYENVFSISRI